MDTSMGTKIYLLSGGNTHTCTHAHTHTHTHIYIYIYILLHLPHYNK